MLAIWNVLLQRRSEDAEKADKNNETDFLQRYAHLIYMLSYIQVEVFHSSMSRHLNKLHEEQDV